MSGESSTESGGEQDWDDVLQRLKTELHHAARGLVDRVKRTMPEAYFNDTDRETLLGHLKAIIAAEATGLPQEIRLRSDDGARFTFVHERSYPGLLAELVCQLPHDRPLLSAKVHTAIDGSLVLDVFEFGPLAPGSADEEAQVRSRVLEYARDHAPDLQAEDLRRHLDGCDAAYLGKCPPQRICEHARLLREVRGSEDTGVALVSRQDLPRGVSELRVAVGRVDAREMFQRIARYLGHQRVDIRRAYLNSFGFDSDDPLSLISLLVSGPAGESLDEPSVVWKRIERELPRLKWLDESTLELAYGLKSWSLDDADALVALCRLTHQVLERRPGPKLAGQRVVDACERNLGIARELVDLLCDRCRDQRANSEDRRGNIERAIDDSVDNEDTRRVLRTVLEVAGACRSSNVARSLRYATSFDVDPRILENDNDETPFGVLFVHGRDFDGFHVRFRDIARGGLRIVRPRGQEQHTLESERLYQEAHGLAWAQQLKNKDIPEGGSKGVILLAPGADPGAAARAYADALFDLVVPASGETSAPTPGRFLYLGPDENVSDELICWIVDRAERRGYPMPNAFMSSKPGVGINHKQYGVTSEGLTVFLEVALRHSGIDPRKRPFTLKLTGGPDGDVAGNEIRILAREFGPNARIVGIADGSGTAEDPQGLDHVELLRLVQADRPIAEFDPAQLGPAGSVLSVDAPGGLRARNTMHNRLRSDAFVPAGGRPRTIHRGNWKDFLSEDGRPSSRVIVEGANLFLTPEARSSLSERGVIIVKDSSANKCGVICSSFEILASMVWSEERFLELKPRFVTDVIEKLRELARLEAERLFDELLHRPAVPLPELSTRLSRAILRAADAITLGIGALGAESHELVRHLVATHFPRSLVEDAGESLFRCLPPGYVDSAVAAVLASRVVYREGLSYLEEMPPDAIVDLALRYVREEVGIARFVEQLGESDLPDRERIADLLREGGTRAAVRRPVGSED